MDKVKTEKKKKHNKRQKISDEKNFDKAQDSDKNQYQKRDANQKVDDAMSSCQTKKADKKGLRAPKKKEIKSSDNVKNLPKTQEQEKKQLQAPKKKEIKSSDNVKNSPKMQKPKKKKLKASKEKKIKSPDSDHYQYTDFRTALATLKRIQKIKVRPKMLQKTVVFKNRRSLSLAISKITGKPKPEERPKAKKNSSQVYSAVGKASMPTILRNCKSNDEKLCCKRIVGTMNFREVQFTMSQLLLQHKWSQAVKCLHHMLCYERCKTTFDDAEMKSLFTLLLNHPDRKMNLLLNLVPVVLKSNEDPDPEKYLSKLLLLPEKLAYPYVFNAPDLLEVQSLPAILRSKKRIEYDGSDTN